MSLIIEQFMPLIILSTMSLLSLLAVYKLETNVHEY